MSYFIESTRTLYRKKLLDLARGGGGVPNGNGSFVGDSPKKAKVKVKAASPANATKPTNGFDQVRRHAHMELDVGMTATFFSVQFSADEETAEEEEESSDEQPEPIVTRASPRIAAAAASKQPETEKKASGTSLRQRFNGETFVFLSRRHVS